MAHETAPPTGSPDTLLRRFALGGDPALAGALFDATAPGLFRLAVALTPDAATAEDVLQSTFVTILETAARYDPARPAWPWLMGILKVKAMEARRKSRRAPDPLRVRPPGSPGDPVAAAETAEEMEEVHRALDELEEPYRAVALMRWRYGLEPAQIAHIQGRPPGTVTSLLSRALAHLRRRLAAVPAVLFGTRLPRGLDEVRRETLRFAATRPGAAAAASTAAAAGGLFFLGKAAAAAAAAIAVAGAAWWLLPGPPPIPQPPFAPPVHDAAVDLFAGPAQAAPAGGAEEPLPSPVDLARCDRDRDLFGVVVDAAGAPVPGARVEAFTRPWERIVPWEHPRHAETATLASGRAASDGTFALRLERGRQAGLRASAPGFADTVLPSCAAGGRVAVTLHAGSTLEVALSEEDGSPRAGQPVLVYREEAPAVRRMGTTGPDGVCAFPGLSPGRLSISTGRPVRRGDPSPVAPASGRLRVPITLVSGGDLVGTVFEAGSGRPIPGALVSAAYSSGAAVPTDAEGRWTLRHWPDDGGVPVHATAVGYVPGVAGAGVLRDDVIEIALRRAVSARGRVVDGAGAPVAGARVGVRGSTREEDKSAAYKGGGLERDDCAVAVTGPDGRFLLDGIDPELVHAIVVEADGLGRTLATLDAGQEDAGDIVLGGGGRIEGVVLGPEGKPEPGVQVFLPQTRGLRHEVPDWTLTKRTCTTDDLGRFRFAAVPPGRNVLGFRAADFAGSYGESGTQETAVELPRGADLLDVVLRAAPGKSITVRVVDSAGRPVEDAIVSSDFRRSMSQLYSYVGRTGPDGRFRYRGLPAKPFRFEAGVDGDPSRERTNCTKEPVLAEDQEIEIALRDAAPRSGIAGTVLGPDGAPAVDMGVQAVDEKGCFGGGAWTDAEGRFAIDVAAGRPWALVVPGHRRHTRAEARKLREEYGELPTPPLTNLRGRFDGVTAPATGISIRLHEAEKDGALAFRLLDVEGSPVEGAEIRFLARGGIREVVTDAKGGARIDGLEAVEETVVVTVLRTGAMREDSVVPEPICVAPGGPEVVLRCRAGSPVDGRVFDADGKPRAGARVFLADPGKQPGSPLGPTATTDADGRFRLFGLPGKEQRLWASWFDADGKAFGGEGAAEPPATDVEIRLAPNRDR